MHRDAHAHCTELTSEVKMFFSFLAESLTIQSLAESLLVLGILARTPTEILSDAKERATWEKVGMSRPGS